MTAPFEHFDDLSIPNIAANFTRRASITIRSSFACRRSRASIRRGSASTVGRLDQSTHIESSTPYRPRCADRASVVEGPRRRSCSSTSTRRTSKNATPFRTRYDEYERSVEQ
ncbi:MAG TPA: hypothetical protein VGC41_12025, partial [Kofleriaceae bacterium]